MRLKDKVAIVTGSSSGLGMNWAEGFAREGAKVVVTSRNAERAQAVVDRIKAEGGEAIGVEAGVSTEEDVRKIVDAAVSAFGGVDILVNNAASSSDQIDAAKPFYEMPIDAVKEMIDTDLLGSYMMCKAVFPHMKEAGRGKIINIVSSTIYRGYPNDGFSHYVAAKMGVVGMSRQMAKEAGKFNITVNCIAPGLTNTANVLERMPGEVLERLAQARSIKRQAWPEDLMGAALFLATEDSDFITGQTLLVDGGSSFL